MIIIPMRHTAQIFLSNMMRLMCYFAYIAVVPCLKEMIKVVESFEFTTYYISNVNRGIAVYNM